MKKLIVVLLLVPQLLAAQTKQETENWLITHLNKCGVTGEMKWESYPTTYYWKPAFEIEDSNLVISYISIRPTFSVINRDKYWMDTVQVTVYVPIRDIDTLYASTDTNHHNLVILETTEASIYKSAQYTYPASGPATPESSCTFSLNLSCDPAFRKEVNMRLRLLRKMYSR